MSCFSFRKAFVGCIKVESSFQKAEHHLESRVETSIHGKPCCEKLFSESTCAHRGAMFETKCFPFDFGPKVRR